MWASMKKTSQWTVKTTHKNSKDKSIKYTKTNQEKNYLSLDPEQEWHMMASERITKEMHHKNNSVFEGIVCFEDTKPYQAPTQVCGICTAGTIQERVEAPTG